MSVCLLCGKRFSESDSEAANSFECMNSFSGEHSIEPLVN